MRKSPFFPTLSAALPQPWLLVFSQAVSCLLDHAALRGAVACRACRSETISDEGRAGTARLQERRISKARGASAAVCQILLLKKCTGTLVRANASPFTSAYWQIRKHRAELGCPSMRVDMCCQRVHVWSDSVWGHLWEMLFGWRKAGAKYNSKTKAFVSTSSILFVLAGYGGSLYEPWVNGVWGEARQKWNSPHALALVSERKSSYSKGD